MTVRVSCPSCNTGFTLPAAPPDGRAACPRCGDVFPTRGRVEEVAGDAPASYPPTAPARTSRPKARLVALVVGMGLVGLAAGGGWYALYGRPKPLPPEPEPTPAAEVTPPVELRGLGYLPPGANVAFAVRPGPVLAFAARTNQNPRDLLTRAGVPASALAALDRAGVTLPQIDHVVGGALVPDADLGQLRLTLALVLTRPLADEDKFLEQLKARRAVANGKTRYDVEFAGLPLRLARVSPTTWVFGWADKDLDATEGAAAALAPGLRESIAEKLPPDAAAWVATDSAAWADKNSVKFLVGQFGKKEWLPALAKGRAAVAGLTFADAPRLRVFVRGADTAVGEHLRAYFAKKSTGDGVRTGGAGEWALFDAPADPQTGFAAVKGFLDNAGK